jgi:hypothetical protein
MQFLNPNMLWGLLALALPVLVHLFNFRKTKRVYFSNVSLLKQVDTKVSSARKLKHLLLLLSRMLFIAAVVIAFAQPVKKAIGLKDLPQGINGIYLDNSQSMQNMRDNRRLLDVAVIKIDELLTLLQRSSNLQLTTNDFEGEDQWISAAGGVRDRLTTVRYSETERDLRQVYMRERSVAQKYNPSAGNHFFWFSDFQKSTAGDLTAIKVDSLDVLHLIPVAGKVSQNVFVDSLWLNVPFVREMQNNVLSVRVYNSGNKAVEKLPLKLYLDEVQISTSSIDLEPESYGTASFNFTVSARGVHKGRISFDDEPITFDNDYFFTLEASPSLRVLHLYGARSPQNYIAKIFSNDSLFQYKSLPVANYNPGEIKNADLVVLEGANAIEGETKLALEEFLQGGGHLAVLPGAQSILNSYQAFLGQYGIRDVQVDAHIPKAEAMVEMAVPEKGSPFFADVFEQGQRGRLMSVPKVYSKIRWEGVGEKILTLRNGKNFLTRTKAGNGQVYVFSAPLDREFGNFAEHALFVPTFFRMAYLSGKSERMAYNFSEGFVRFILPEAPKNAVYKLKSRDLEIIPVQSLRGNTLTLTLPKTADLESNQAMGAGIYSLEINGKAVKTLALNHSRAESRMDTYSPQELEEVFADQKNVKVYEDVEDGEFIDAFRSTGMDKVYWKYFIVAALFFLLAEMLIYRLFP